jgi:hypothetical protein
MATKLFPVQKTEIEMAEDIAAAISHAEKSVEQTTVAMIEAACAANIVKMQDASGRVGYIVKGTDRNSPLYATRAEAVALVERAIRGSIAEGKARAMKAMKRPDPYAPTDDPIAAPGLAGSPLDDEDANYDPRLAMQQRPRHGRLDGATIFSRRKSDGPLMDGKRWPARRTKRARIL